MSAKNFKDLLQHIKANKIPCGILLNSLFKETYKLYAYHNLRPFEITTIEEDYLIIKDSVLENSLSIVPISKIAQIQMKGIN